MKPFIVLHQSFLRTHKEQRRKVKQVLHQQKEPMPQYRTGKFWNI